MPLWARLNMNIKTLASSYLKSLQSVSGLAFTKSITQDANNAYSIQFKTPSNTGVRVDLALSEAGAFQEGVLLWKKNTPENFASFEELLDAIPEESDDLRILFQDKKYISNLKKSTLEALSPLGMDFKIDLVTNGSYSGLLFEPKKAHALTLNIGTYGNSWTAIMHLMGHNDLIEALAASGFVAKKAVNFIIKVTLDDYSNIEDLLSDLKDVIAIKKGQA